MNDDLRVGRWCLAGGWCWQRVACRPREEGRDVYPATLTGFGERVHLASPEVDLEIHITDVVNPIEFEHLYDVVLLGHSYAGLVVTQFGELPVLEVDADGEGSHTPT